MLVNHIKCGERHRSGAAHAAADGYRVVREGVVRTKRPSRHLEDLFERLQDLGREVNLADDSEEAFLLDQLRTWYAITS